MSGMTRSIAVLTRIHSDVLLVDNPDRVNAQFIFTSGVAVSAQQRDTDTSYLVTHGQLHF